MSTAKIVTIICWVIVAIVLVGLVFWVLTGSLFGISTGFRVTGPVFNIGSFDNMTGPFNEVGSYTVTAESVRGIDVRWVSGSVSVTPYDGDVIKITETARRTLKDEEKLSFDVDGSGKLVVQYTKPGIRMNMVTKKLELLVPKSVANELSQLNVNATSADLKISDFSVKSFGIQETSGTSVRLQHQIGEMPDVHSVSGEIMLTNVTTAQLSLGTVSGEIKLQGVTADAIESQYDLRRAAPGRRVQVRRRLQRVRRNPRHQQRQTPAGMNCNTTSGSIHRDGPRQQRPVRLVPYDVRPLQQRHSCENRRFRRLPVSTRSAVTSG